MSERHRLHARSWQFMLDRFEVHLRVKAARNRTAFLKDAATAYEANGSVPGWVLERHRRAVSNALAEQYQRVIPRFAGLLRKQMKFYRPHRETKAGLFEHLMAEWISTQALAKARYIAATDMDDVRSAIQSGIDEGDGTDAIARRIREVSKLTPTRAATVARTETNAAATYGYMGAAREAEQEHGIRLLKVWLAANDDRTRPAHLAMNGHPPIPLDEKFEVDGELMDRPGDPAGSAANTIACRCSLAVEEAE